MSLQCLGLTRQKNRVSVKLMMIFSVGDQSAIVLQEGNRGLLRQMEQGWSSVAVMLERGVATECL